VLRDLLVVWGVKSDTPEQKAERELHRADLELLEAELLAEEFDAKAALLRTRIRRLEARVSEDDRLDGRVRRAGAKARLELLETEAQAEEMRAKVTLLRNRIERLRQVAKNGIVPAMPMVAVKLSELDELSRALSRENHATA
jgi:adenosylmethionine-8-amino-7-oxononanoate aminotransferase